MPQDINYGFYQDQTLKPYDPNDYIAAMQQGNPFFNPAYPTMDAVGGLSATMKSIKAMQLQSEMAAENKRRYDEEAKRRQQALDQNIDVSQQTSPEGMRTVAGEAGITNPLQVGNFIGGHPNQPTIPQSYQAQHDMLSTGFEQVNSRKPSPDEDAKIWDRVYSDKEFSSGWGTAQAAGSRAQGDQSAYKIYSAFCTQVDDLVAQGVLTEEEGLNKKLEFKANKPGAVAAGEGKQTKLDQDYVLNNVTAKIERSMEELKKNAETIVMDPLTKKEKEKLTEAEESAFAAIQLRYKNLQKIIAEVLRLKKNRTTNGAYVISSNILGKLSDILNAKAALSDKDPGLDTTAGQWIQMLIAELEAEGKQVGTKIVEKQAAAGIKK